MTKKEKVDWLTNTTNEQVVDHLKWVVIRMTNQNNNIGEQIEAQEDYNLAVAEILKRMK